MKNYLKYSFWFILSLLVTLVGLHFLPVLTVDGHTLRRVDLLSDLRFSTDEDSANGIDSTALLPKIKPAFVDSCPQGMTCIEDYSDSTSRGMSPFYKAIERLKSNNGMVRIAVFGDSFIEADIFTADLRELLQKQFGGCGVGFVPMTSMTSGYRTSVRHSFGGWSSHSVVDTSYFDKRRQDVSGHYFIPKKGAYAELRGQNRFGTLLDTCAKATIFMLNKDSVKLKWRMNKNETQTCTLAPSNKIQRKTVEGHIGSIRWTVDRADSTLFYGMAMDGKRGLILDNFSLRGSTGLTLKSVPKANMCAFNALRPYDLIILQYGLNIASERGKSYDFYRKGLKKTIARLKECFPQAGFLLLSVSDRDYKTETGDLKTMPGVKNLVRYQQTIAAENNIAFWNLFEAMGGDGSMAKMVFAKPPLANYDFTHINFRGGKYLADLLYKSLMHGKKQHDKRVAYEKQ